MNCPEVVEVMQRYLDYDLSQKEVEEMFSHIASCSECAETFRMLKSLSRELEDLPEVTPKFSLVDAIMPQLDEIDRSRQERSAASSDQDDTVVPLSARKTRRQRLLSSTAGRTLLGTAAAAVVLLVAVINNEPKELSNAEMQLMTTTTDSQDAEQGSVSHLTEDTSGANTPVADQDLLDQSISSSDARVEEEQTEKLDAASRGTANNAPATAPDQGGKSPSDAAMKGSPQAPAEPQQNSADQSQQPSAKEPSVSSEEPNADPSTNAADANPDAAESQVADAGIMRIPDSQEDGPAVTEAPDQSVSMDDNEKREATEPEGMLFGIQRIPLAPQQWLSADQHHLAMLEGQELVLYSVTDLETNDMKELQRIELKGEWVSGEWSADSAVFNYQTNQAGKMVKDKVTVAKPVTEKKKQ